MVAQPAIGGCGMLQRAVPAQEEAGVAESGESICPFAVLPGVSGLLCPESEITVGPGKGIDGKSLKDHFPARFVGMVPPYPGEAGIRRGLDVFEIRVEESLTRDVG